MDRFGCPIEMEPKTLHEGELNNAREAAVEIIQTKEAKEASRIFTQGKKAIKTTEQMKKEIEKRDQLHKLVKEREGTEVCNRSWDLPFTLNDDDEFNF